ncbi:MAG: 4-aminobutyrate--2-oxoglutarate transaminase [Bacteriovoracia bacterium]
MPKLVTEIPGPKSKALMERRRSAVARGPFHSTPIFVNKAHGAIVEDVDGNEFIDFGCGIGVTNLGHTPDFVVEEVQWQAQNLIHSSFNVAPYEVYVSLCEKLNKVTPGDFAKKTFLANSGAEAVENAIKIARFATGRQAVVCFDHAFHGRTYMALSLTSKVKPYKEGFAPFNGEVYRAPFPYLYRNENIDAFKVFEEMVQSQISASKVAAVIIEPVLGEGGFVPAPESFMKNLREFCSKNGIVLIADEIQTGFGRTGKLFACDHYGVTPDLITLAKGLGCGMPISAVTGRAELMDAVPEGGIGGTYGGNPLSCIAALEVLDHFEKTDVLERARKVGEKIRQRTSMWKEKFSKVGDARGLGPMQAIELVKDRKTKEPDKESVGKLTRYCYENGVITLSAGTYGNVVRLLVPVNIEDKYLDEGLNIMEEGLKKL